MTLNLAEELGKFDGKHVASLQKLAAQILKHEGSVDEVLAIANSSDVNAQTAATWVLKQLQEKDAVFSSTQTEEVLLLLGSLTHWEAILHVLQMLDRFEIPSQNSQGLYRTLKHKLGDHHKLVRAWSYNGLFVLGEQHPRFRTEINGLLDDAKIDDAASVRARARNICKALRWG